MRLEPLASILALYSFVPHGKGPSRSSWGEVDSSVSIPHFSQSTKWPHQGPRAGYPAGSDLDKLLIGDHSLSGFGLQNGTQPCMSACISLISIY